MNRDKNGGIRVGKLGEEYGSIHGKSNSLKKRILSKKTWYSHELYSSKAKNIKIEKISDEITWEISRDIDSKCNYNIFNQLISSTIIERVGHWKCFSINVERFKSRSQMLRLKTHMISRSMPHQYFVILSNFMIIIFNWVVIILILDNHS